MNQHSMMVSAKLVASLFSLVPWSAPAGAATVTTEKAACDLTKARVAERDHFPVSAIAFCDSIVPEAQPKGFYALGLHGQLDDCGGDVCGSTLMGWFAVQKATGQVFEWDVVEDRLGQRVKVRQHRPLGSFRPIADIGAPLECDLSAVRPGTQRQHTSCLPPAEAGSHC